MIATAKPLFAAIHLPGWRLPRFSVTERRRRQATIDLIHSSPHLLRDIGASESDVTGRRGK